MAKSDPSNQPFLTIQQRVESIPPAALAQELQRNAQALIKTPKNAVLTFAVGLMYARIGDFESAIKVLKRALKLSRSNEVILGVLAFIHANQLGDSQTAITYLQKKILLNKQDGAAHLLLANCFMNVSEPAKALAAIEKAEPFVDAAMQQKLHAMRAQCHQRMGDFQSAREELLKLADIDPLGLVGVADVLSRLPELPDELAEKLQTEMSSALEEGTERFRDANHEAMTAIAVAERLEKQQDYRKAFTYFKRANELQPRDENAWGWEETREFEIIRNVFDEAIFKTLPDGHPSEKHVFVVGMPRSGTTLLESILASHKNVIDHGELSFFHEQLYRLGFTAQQSPNVDQQVQTVRKLLQAAPLSGFTDIAEAYRNRYRMDQNKNTYHVDKMPHNFRALGIIAATFPNAKVIHARRHPMDTCLSNFKTLLPGYNTTFGQSPEEIGAFYIQYANLMRYWKQVLPLEIFDVRYEDLVNDTPTHAKTVIEFCGIEWDEKSLANRARKKDTRTASIWQVRQDVYTTSVEKWRLYEEELQPLRDILADEIKRYEAGE